jgi:hypothetical protein
MAAPAAQSCSVEPLCTELSTCAEADFYFRQCHHLQRDADSDGIPCENLCGATQSTYLARRSVGAIGEFESFELVQPAFSCGSKRTCGQMVSCEEAEFHLNQCGLGSLDRDGDGVPCESICR